MYLVMTAVHETTSEETRTTEPSNEPRASQSSVGPAMRKSRQPKRLRLPLGVLVRVDVLEDEHGHIGVYTRERLSPGWGGERNEVASLLVQTGLAVLDGFAQERRERGGVDEGEGEDDGPSPHGPHRPDQGPEAPTPRADHSETADIYRPPPLTPDTRRTYG